MSQTTTRKKEGIEIDGKEKFTTNKSRGSQRHQLWDYQG